MNTHLPCQHNIQQLPNRPFSDVTSQCTEQMGRISLKFPAPIAEGAESKFLPQ